MRTTLDLEDDIYLHARQIAAAEHVSVGKIVSRMMRESLHAPTAQPSASQTPEASGYVIVNGIPVIAADTRVITQELIERIREDEGI